jgi:uncharacterized protein (DUF3084 family)
MGKKIAIIVLAVLLVVTGVLLANFFNLANDLRLRLDEKTALLEQTTAELAQHKTELTATKTELAATKTELTATKTELTATKTELTATKTELTVTKTELSNVRNDLAQTTNKLTQSEADLTRYKAQVSSLTKVAEDNKFYFYYVKPKQQQLDVYKLDSLVKSLKWLTEYQANLFDCSEMTAALERELENAGFHTIIAVGTTPGKPGTRHAWLLVEAEAGKYIPVEATIPSVVWWEYPYFNDYFKYDRSFETIQEALAYNSTDYDWWKL